MNNKAMVVTPVYCTKENKRLHMLLQSIYWVQQQTHKDTVHVIVDDGSTDETPEVLEAIAKNNDSILVFHKENGGQSAAINFGVQEALKQVNPDFITVCHSDDILTPTSLEDRISLARQADAAMVYSQMIVFYEDETPERLCSGREFSDAGSFYKSLLTNQGIPYSTMLWDKDFFMNLGGFDERLRYGEDWEMAIKTAAELSRTCKKFAKLHRPTMAYRLHKTNGTIGSIKNGTKLWCYHIIWWEHLKIKEYIPHMAKETILTLPSMLPEGVKKCLRPIRNAFRPPIEPYESEFMDLVRGVDYQRAIIPD